MEEEERQYEATKETEENDATNGVVTKGESCDVKVQIRLKQCEEKESTRYHVYSHGTQLHVPNMKGRLELDRWYGFDYIYSTIASNKEVYRRASYDLVESALDGINTALFAYGQTASGKTHTLMSKDGVTARMISHLFHRIWKNRSHDYKISCSYFQIYNEQIYDLLNPRNAECFIREDTNGEVYIENIVNVSCETPMDVYELINIGRKSLVIGETKMGRFTCSSHALCQLSIEKRWRRRGERKRSMQETYLADGTCVDENESGYVSSDVDFYTVPFDKVELKRRHKHATHKINEQKCMFRSPSSLNQSPSSRTEKIHRSASTDQSPRLAFKFDSLRPGSSNSRVNSRPSSRSSSRNDFVRSCSTPPTTQTETEFADASFNKSPKSPARAIKSRIPTLKRPRYQSTASNASGTSETSLAYSPPKWSTIDSDSESIRFESENSFSFSEGCSEDYYDIDDSPFTDEIDENIDPDMPVQNSRINIIDLAGSERITDTNIDEEHLKEVQKINLSLLELGNVISALASGKKKKHIPYRNSVLTRLLQDSLGGNCKTTFLLCVSTKEKDAYETKCTLEFGQKLGRICTKPVMNLDVDYKRKYEELMKVIKNNEKNDSSDSSANSSIDITIKKEIEAGKSYEFGAESTTFQVENSKHENENMAHSAPVAISYQHQQEDDADISLLQNQIDQNEKKLKKKSSDHLDLQVKYFQLQEDSWKLKQGMLGKVANNDAETNTSFTDLSKIENEEVWEPVDLHEDAVKAIKQELLELQSRYNSLVEETKTTTQNDVAINTDTPNKGLVDEDVINLVDVSNLQAEIDYKPPRKGFVDEDVFDMVDVGDVQTELDFSDFGAFYEHNGTIGADISFPDISMDKENVDPSLIDLKDKEINDLREKYERLLDKMAKQEESERLDAPTNTLNKNTSMNDSSCQASFDDAKDEEIKTLKTKYKNLLVDSKRTDEMVKLDVSTTTSDEEFLKELKSNMADASTRTSFIDAKDEDIEERKKKYEILLEESKKPEEAPRLDVILATPYLSLSDATTATQSFDKEQSITEENGKQESNKRSSTVFKKETRVSKSFNDAVFADESDAKAHAQSVMVDASMNASCPDLSQENNEDKLTKLTTKYNSLLGNLEQVVQKKKKERMDSETNTSNPDLSRESMSNEHGKEEITKLKTKYHSLLGSLEKVIEKKKNERIDSETNTSFPDLTKITDAAGEERRKLKDEEDGKNALLLKQKDEEMKKLKTKYHALLEKVENVVVRKKSERQMCDTAIQTLDPDLLNENVNRHINKAPDDIVSPFKSIGLQMCHTEIQTLDQDLLKADEYTCKTTNDNKDLQDSIDSNESENQMSESIPKLGKENIFLNPHSESILGGPKHLNEFKLVLDKPNFDESRFDISSHNDIKIPTNEPSKEREKGSAPKISREVSDDVFLPPPMNIKDSAEGNSKTKVPNSEEEESTIEEIKSEERASLDLTFRYEFMAASEDNLDKIVGGDENDSSSPFAIKVVHIPDEPLFRDFSTSTDDIKATSLGKPETRDVSTSTEDGLNEEKSEKQSKGAPIVVTFIQPEKPNATKDIGNNTALVKRPSNADDIITNQNINTKSAIQFWLFNLKQSLHQCQQTLLSDDNGFVTNEDINPSDAIPTNNLSAIMIDLFEVIFRTFCDVRSPLEEPETSSMVDTSLIQKRNKASLMRSHAEKLATIHESLMDRKNTIEKDLFCFIKESSSSSDELEFIPENHNLIAVITNNMFDENFMLTDFDFKLNDMLNLVLAEHTLTACSIALSKSLKSLNYISLGEQVYEEFPSSPRQTRPQARNSSPTPNVSYETFPHPRNSYISIDLGDKKPRHLGDRNPRNSYVSVNGDKEKIDSNIPVDDGDEKKPFLNRVFCMPIKSRKAKESKKKKSEQKTPLKR